jgi:DNA primase
MENKKNLQKKGAIKMTLKDQLKEQLKKEISIIILLKYFNLLSKNHNPNYYFPCPIHEGKNNNCRYISNKNTIFCYSFCKQSYDVFDVYSKIINENHFYFVKNKLYQLFKTEKFQQFIQEYNQIKEFSTSACNSKNNEIVNYDDKQIQQIKIQLFKKTSPLFNQIRDFYHQKLIMNYNNESFVGLEYLTKTRKLSLDTIKEFKLGFAPLNDRPLSFQLINYLKKQQSFNETNLLKYGLIKQRHREDGTSYFHDSFCGSIIIPIENGNSKTFHFYENHFRQIEYKNGYKQKKYKSLPRFSNTPTFFFSYRFFEALPFIKETKKVYVVEGFFDVVQSWNHGIKNVIGTISILSKMSKAQINILKKNNIQVIVIPDNDKTGYGKANDLFIQLQEEQISCQLFPIKEKYNQKQKCKDVDDLLKQHGIEAFYESFT